MKSDIASLLHSENEQLKKLQHIVKQAMEEEKLIVQNLLNPPKEILSKGQKYPIRWHVLAVHGPLLFLFLSYSFFG